MCAHGFSLLILVCSTVHTFSGGSSLKKKSTCFSPAIRRFNSLKNHCLCPSTFAALEAGISQQGCYDLKSWVEPSWSRSFAAGVLLACLPWPSFIHPSSERSPRLPRRWHLTRSTCFRDLRRIDGNCCLLALWVMRTFPPLGGPHQPWGVFLISFSSQENY